MGPNDSRRRAKSCTINFPFFKKRAKPCTIYSPFLSVAEYFWEGQGLGGCGWRKRGECNEKHSFTVASQQESELSHLTLFSWDQFWGKRSHTYYLSLEAADIEGVGGAPGGRRLTRGIRRRRRRPGNCFAFEQGGHRTSSNEHSRARQENRK